MGSRDGHSYYCSTDRMRWPDAKAFCEANGGYLAIINDSGENSFLASLLQANSAYIGLSDHEEEGVFRWLDGSGLTYQKWYPGQPNNYDYRQDYVEILRSGYWNDQYNDKPLEFIMEIPCISIEQTSGPTDLSEVTGDTSVSFTIEDACGNTSTCSYQIVVEQDVQMSCSTDIGENIDGTETVVYYPRPTLSSCCNNCTPGQNIPGYSYIRVSPRITILCIMGQI